MTFSGNFVGLLWICESLADDAKTKIHENMLSKCNSWLLPNQILIS